MTWTALAEQLAEDARDLGAGAAVLNAAAWQARVDPDATRGLVAAALALWASPGALFPPGPGLQDDREMLEHAADLEAGAAELLKCATDLHRGAEGDLESAAGEARAATQALASAKTTHDRANAQVTLAGAKTRIADCEVALEITGDAGQRLKYACAKLQCVPADLEVTYEVPYAVVRSGGKLPYSGEFLTGVTQRGAA